MMDSGCMRTFAELPLMFTKEWLKTFCASRPSCQWSAPGSSMFCSSTGYFRATDSDGLVEGEERKAAERRMCDENNMGATTQRKQLLPLKFDCEASELATQFSRSFWMTGGEDPNDEKE